MSPVSWATLRPFVYGFVGAILALALWQLGSVAIATHRQVQTLWQLEVQRAQAAQGIQPAPLPRPE